MHRANCAYAAEAFSANYLQTRHRTTTAHGWLGVVQSNSVLDKFIKMVGFTGSTSQLGQVKFRLAAWQRVSLISTASGSLAHASPGKQQSKGLPF